MTIHENVEFTLGHSKRMWTSYAVSGELTDEQVATLRGEDEAALKLARHLYELGVLVEQYTEEEEAHEPFDDGSDPAVIEVVTEEDGDTRTPAERYADGLQRAHNAGRYAHLGYTFYADKPGRKFTRVVENTGNQRLVHAFVENQTGRVFKAESWRRPAPGARYETVEQALEVMEAAEGVRTGYLYR